MVESDYSNHSKLTLAGALSSYEEQVLSDAEIHRSMSRECLEGYKDVLSLLAKRGRSHSDYRHYATRSRIEGIIKNSALFLTDGSTWNDKYDSERFNPSFADKKRYGICFSSAKVESIAMWMLYGGPDGNGAMIDFDSETLLKSTKLEHYECGYFDAGGEFKSCMTLPSGKLDLQLVDVLYFHKKQGNLFSVGRPSRKEKGQVLGREAFDGIKQIMKHQSWSYEEEVRLVATINTDDFENRASHIKCIKIPLEFSDAFVSGRVFDSPVADGFGAYCDSELRGTVIWNLCANCKRFGS